MAALKMMDKCLEPKNMFSNVFLFRKVLGFELQELWIDGEQSILHCSCTSTHDVQSFNRERVGPTEAKDAGSGVIASEPNGLGVVFDHASGAEKGPCDS